MTSQELARERQASLERQRVREAPAREAIRRQREIDAQVKTHRGRPAWDFQRIPRSQRDRA